MSIGANKLSKPWSIIHVINSLCTWVACHKKVSFMIFAVVIQDLINGQWQWIKWGPACQCFLRYEKRYSGKKNVESTRRFHTHRVAMRRSLRTEPQRTWFFLDFSKQILSECRTKILKHTFLQHMTPVMSSGSPVLIACRHSIIWCQEASSLSPKGTVMLCQWLNSVAQCTLSALLRLTYHAKSLQFTTDVGSILASLGQWVTH